MPDNATRRAFDRERRARHPVFATAVKADAREAFRRRGEVWASDNPLYVVSQVIRLALVADTFFAQVCYRGKAACQRRRVPLVPRILHRLAIAHGQVCIGDPVVMAAGVYLPHGQVVIDGITEIGSGCVIAPFTSIGLTAGDLLGPTIGPGSRIGTGSRVLGPITLGPQSVVGANAVVLRDVDAGAVVVGVPARTVAPRD